MDEEVVKLVGTVFVGQLLIAALDRYRLAPDERTPFALYCDEFQRFATPDFATIFNEARKYGIALTIAHQTRVQLDDPKIASGAKSAGNIGVFQVAGEDAEELAKEFDHTPPPAEITGYKAGRELSRYPIQSLMSKGHPDQWVMEIVRGEIIPLKNARMKYPFTEEGLRRLDAFFAEVMASGEVVNNETLMGAVWPLAQEVGVSELAGQYGINKDDFEAFQLGKEGEIERIIQRLAANYATTVEEHEKQPYSGRFISRPHHFERDIRQQAPIFAQFVQRMTYIGQMLYEHPVYEASSEQEPIYGSVRTYADMENEITTQLVTMPLFHARCKLSSHEHTIRTFPSPPTGDDYRPVPIGDLPPVPDDGLPLNTLTVERPVPVNQRRIPQRDR